MKNFLALMGCVFIALLTLGSTEYQEQQIQNIKSGLDYYGGNLKDIVRTDYEIKVANAEAMEDIILPVGNWLSNSTKISDNKKYNINGHLMMLYMIL